MPHRAPRLLHVLLSVPVTVVAAAAAPAPSAHAQNTSRPSPIVVAIDPGHGGTPNSADPSQPFDPGTIAADGTEEKDVTLDVAKRVQALLQQDLVQVVMTRTTDTYVGIETRMQTAIDAGAAAFVSIHFNAYNDQNQGGVLVLYPNDQSQPFAQLMDSRLDAQVSSFGEPDNGIAPKTDLWVHATMPAVTVEGGYLSNPADAARIESDAYQSALAAGIRDGIEAQLPDIARRKLQLQAWDSLHAIHFTLGGGAPAQAASGVVAGAREAATTSPLAKPLIAAALLLAAFWQRHRLERLPGLLVELCFPGLRRRRLRAQRLQTQRLRRHAALERSRLRADPPARRPRVRRRTVFDDARF